MNKENNSILYDVFNRHYSAPTDKDNNIGLRLAL